MKSFSFPRLSALLGITSLAFGALACTSSISGGGGGGGSDTGTGNGIVPSCGWEPGQPGCPDDPSNPPSPSAIALLASQMGWGDDSGAGGSSSSGVGGGPGVDSNTLYIEIGNPGPVCADPNAFLDCGGRFRISIGIPPALQHPGVIPLDAPAIVSTFMETGLPGDNGFEECPFGGGSFWEGSVEILSIDAQAVTVRLSGTPSLFFAGLELDGDYVALRCP